MYYIFIAHLMYIIYQLHSNALRLGFEINFILFHCAYSQLIFCFYIWPLNGHFIINSYFIQQYHFANTGLFYFMCLRNNISQYNLYELKTVIFFLSKWRRNNLKIKMKIKSKDHIYYQIYYYNVYQQKLMIYPIKDCFTRVV